MSNLKKKRNNRASAGHRPLMIAALVASGILQPLLPVLAGTAAGETISNTATATYTDDNNNPFAATSNVVKILVAPISGLTVKPTGITDTDAGAVEEGDSLEYNFDIKNVGNTAAPIFIPKPTVTNFNVTSVEYSYVDGAGAPQTGTIPLIGGSLPSNLPANGTVTIKVIGTVPTTGVIAGDPVAVTLGNTGANDNSPTTQNVVETLDDGTAADNDEVRTTFVVGGTNPADNKEASATQSIPFATKATKQAFPLIKKTATRALGATSVNTDDIITYNLNFSVLNSSPNGSLTPEALEGTPIKLNGATESKILVSDAIPEGTVLKAPLVAPSNWTAVYSASDVATTIPVAATGGTAAEWSTTVPTLSTVKRVGFIYDPTPAPVAPAVASIAPSAPAVDFSIEVITSNLPTGGGKIYNIAQAFGETKGADKVVLDESGDNTPSNAGTNGVPIPFDPAVDTGKADPTKQGIDTAGDNSGTGDKGEDNEIVIGSFVPTTDSIFNGPNGQPTAVGPNDINDDFTNASTPVAPGLSPTANIATALTGTFNNTIKNPTTVTLADVTVQPISPTKADVADNNGTSSTTPYLGTATIPEGTLVTLTDLTPGTTKLPVVYKFVGGDFVIQPASGTTTQGTPLNFGSLAPGAVANYKTEVTLPINSVTPLTAIAIPLVAFTDDATTGFGTELTNNITIDRVYTGYMKLFKEARILAADKNTVVQDWTDGTGTGGTLGLLSTKALTGQFIEYRIKYENISTSASGSGNVILNAKNFKLTEDGAAVVGANTNNWAGFTTHQQNTLASQGGVTYFDGVTTLGITDQPNGNAVTKYENLVTNVAPAGQGTFQFRRLVSDSTPLPAVFNISN